MWVKEKAGQHFDSCISKVSSENSLRKGIEILVNTGRWGLYWHYSHFQHLHFTDYTSTKVKFKEISAVTDCCFVCCAEGCTCVLQWHEVPLIFSSCTTYWQLQQQYVWICTNQRKRDCKQSNVAVKKCSFQILYKTVFAVLRKKIHLTCLLNHKNMHKVDWWETGVLNK